MSLARLLFAGLVAIGLVVPVSAAPAPPKPKPVDVVICLDVSGSMQGLVAAAKQRLWDLVNDLARVKPTPELRVGLYSYGHTSYPRESGWVRKDSDLTTDLDEVYKKLTALTINGGEEYVARVTKAALEELKWSDDTDALRIIFVAGNEPATQDPANTLAAVAELARKKGVIVNTIYCGNADNSEAVGYRDFATMCGGRFASIDHNQSTVAVATPYDRKLVELGQRLNRTYVAYGAAGKARAENQVAQDSNALKESVQAAASRTTAKASALYRNAAWDLVDKLKEDQSFDVKKLKPEELPEEMRQMTPEQREAHVKKLAEERAKLQAEIATVSQERQRYLDDEAKKSAGPGAKRFDAALRGILRDQAGQRGLIIPGETENADSPK